MNVNENIFMSKLETAINGITHPRFTNQKEVIKALLFPN